MWKRSLTTRTWPSVPFPDPIPIVGIASFEVIAEAASGATHSRTRQKAPASPAPAPRRAAGRPGRGPCPGSGNPQLVDGLGGQPDMADHGDAVGDQPPRGLEGGGGRPLELDRLGPGPPHDLDPVADPVLRDGVAPEGHVHHHQLAGRPRLTAPPKRTMSGTVTARVVPWPRTTFPRLSPTRIMSVAVSESRTAVWKS